jgi:hypothetical protein
LYQKNGCKTPFILCIVFAGIDLLLRVGLVERRNRPVEWFEKMNAPTFAPSTMINNPDGEEDGSKKKKKISIIMSLYGNFYASINY